jgi:hypothetical protein
VCEYDDHSVVRTSPGLGYEEDDLLLDLYSLEKIKEEARACRAKEYVPLFIQARKILDHK